MNKRYPGVDSTANAGVRAEVRVRLQNASQALTDELKLVDVTIEGCVCACSDR